MRFTICVILLSVLVASMVSGRFRDESQLKECISTQCSMQNTGEYCYQKVLESFTCAGEKCVNNSSGFADIAECLMNGIDATECNNILAGGQMVVFNTCATQSSNIVTYSLTAIISLIALF